MSRLRYIQFFVLVLGILVSFRSDKLYGQDETFEISSPEEINRRAEFFEEMVRISDERAKREVIEAAIDPSLLFALLKDKKSWETLELSESQKKELETIYEGTNEKISEKYGLSFNGDRRTLFLDPDFRKLEKEQQNEIMKWIEKRDEKFKELFLFEQRKSLANATLRLGLPLAVVDSPVTKLLDLSDEQKKAIVKSSKKTADKMEQMLAEIHFEFLNAIRSELSLEQWDKLEEIYGKTALENSVRRSVRGTIHQFRFYRTYEENNYEEK